MAADESNIKKYPLESLLGLGRFRNASPVLSPAADVTARMSELDMNGEPASVSPAHPSLKNLRAPEGAAFAPNFNFERLPHYQGVVHLPMRTGGVTSALLSRRLENKSEVKIPPLQMTLLGRPYPLTALSAPAALSPLDQDTACPTPASAGFLDHKAPNRNNRKTYICPHCGRSLIGKSGLKRHMRTHTGEKPFQCPICSKCFSQKGTLQAHLRTHSGEMPYKCDHCDNQFRYRGSLTRHLNMYCSVLKAQRAQQAAHQVSS